MLRMPLPGTNLLGAKRELQQVRHRQKRKVAEPSVKSPRNAMKHREGGLKKDCQPNFSNKFFQLTNLKGK